MARFWLAVVLAAVVGATGAADTASAQPQYAAMVMDARTGEVLHARNADTRLHPASLTKMMTLYLTFEAIRDGKLSLDQRVPVSAHAAARPPSKIGFRPGQRVTVRELIRATAIRSANDAAVVLAEAVAGSESRFAELMTRRAREIGMGSTTFRNASGLTAAGQLSTARDMTVLGRRMLYDFPQYYNLFGRQSTDAFGRRLNNTNRLLSSYSGADGIKTGFTRAAGFNLVASAERNGVRVIATVFGGRSAATRNAEVARLLDLGFAQAPARVRERPPATQLVRFDAPSPPPRPWAQPEPAESLLVAGARAVGEALAPAAAQAAAPPPAREEPIRLAEVNPTRQAPRRALAPPARFEGDGRGEWAVFLGAFPNREHAVANLAAVALGPVPALSEAERRIDVAAFGDTALYSVTLAGIDAATAHRACAMIAQEGRDCVPVPPAE
ncbi:MAG: D-alanyl-D-alanine carboxypeptidase [Rhodobacteraceae bacterium]|nr:MAG: D-alanyl-D-alanine carboxypeptidase [Paracoccaceae bacterium]